MFEGWTDEQAGTGRERVPRWGDSLGAMSHIKLGRVHLARIDGSPCIPASWFPCERFGAAYRGNCLPSMAKHEIKLTNTCEKVVGNWGKLQVEENAYL